MTKFHFFSVTALEDLLHDRFQYTGNYFEADHEQSLAENIEKQGWLSNFKRQM